MFLYLFFFLFFGFLDCIESNEKKIDLFPPASENFSLMALLDEEKKRVLELENLVQEQQHKLLLNSLEIEASQKVNKNLLESLELSENKNENMSKQLCLLDELVKNLQNSYFRDIANNFLQHEKEKEDLKEVFAEILEKKSLFSFKKLCKKLLEDKLLMTKFKVDIKDKVLDLQKQNDKLLDQVQSNQVVLKSLKQDNFELEKQLQEQQQLMEDKLKENNLKINILEGFKDELNKKNEDLEGKDDLIIRLKKEKKNNLLELDNIYEQLKQIQSKIKFSKDDSRKKEASFLATFNSVQKKADFELDQIKDQLKNQEKALEETKRIYRKKLSQAENTLKEHQTKNVDLSLELKLVKDDLLFLKNSSQILHQNLYDANDELEKLKKELVQVKDAALHLDFSHREALDYLEKKKVKIRSLKQRVNNQAPQIGYLEETLFKKNQIIAEACLQKEALLNELSLAYSLLDIFKVNQNKQDQIRQAQDILLKQATNEILIQNQRFHSLKNDVFVTLEKAGVFELVDGKGVSLFVSRKTQNLLEKCIFSKKFSDLMNLKAENIESKELITMLCGNDFKNTISDLLPLKNSLSSILKTKSFIENASLEDRFELFQLRAKEIINVGNAYKLLLARKNILPENFKLDLNLDLAWNEFKNFMAEYFQDKNIQSAQLTKQTSDNLILKKLVDEIETITF